MVNRIANFVSNNWKNCLYWFLIILWGSLAGFCFIYILDASLYGTWQ